MIDCHSHLSFIEQNDVVATVISNSQISCWIQGGYDPEDWSRQVELKKLFPDKIKTCMGLHPWFVRSQGFDKSQHMNEWKEMMGQADFIGEIGLDFFDSTVDQKKELQAQVFEEQLSFASGKPMVLHVVKAHGTALSIIKDHIVRGYIHSFSGSTEVANEYIAHGLMLSFGPSILNENYKKAREALEALPLESILVESDSPSDSSSRGYDFELFIRTMEEVAKIKKIGLEELRMQIEKNLNSIMVS